MKEKNDLTSGETWKKLILFFLPIAAGTLIQQLYNAVDGFIVGRFVGTTALAAVGGSAAMIINVLVGFFVSMTSGASVVIAQIFGAGRNEDVQKASEDAVAVSAIMGVVLAIIGYISAPSLLELLKTPENTIAESVIYLRIYYVGVPFILVLNMESNIMRAVGNSFQPFLFMIIGCISNIIMDFVFVMYFKMGVEGVAWATVIAQVINMALLTGSLLKTDEPYRMEFGTFKFNGMYLRNMLRIGIPAGLQTSMYSVSNMIIQVAVNTLGTVIVASWAMASKLDGLYWATINAFGVAITAFIAQNYGAGNMDRVKKCVKQSLLISYVITISSSVFLLLIGKPAISVLTHDKEVIYMTFLIMTYFVPYYFLWVPVEVFSAVLRGSGDATIPVVIVGVGICLFRVIWIVTVFAYFKTLLSLAICYVASWAVTGVALIIYYRFGKWENRGKAALLGK